MFKMIIVVALMAIVAFYALKEAGEEERENGSRCLGNAMVACGLLVGCAIFVGFSMLIGSSDQKPYGMRALADDKLPAQLLREVFVVHAPVGCIVYFKTDNDVVRPVKSTGDGIPFEKNENTAVLSGKKCQGPVRVAGPRKPMSEIDKSGTVTIRI